MRQFLQKLAIYITVIAIIYSIISFLALECSPLEWGWFGRLAFAFLILSGLSISEKMTGNNKLIAIFA